MPQYGMVIDLKRCYGCYACVMACKVKNHTPPKIFWARLLKSEQGKFPNTVRQALPVLCMQCDEPSCMEVCPTGATVQLDNGIVIVDHMNHLRQPFHREVFALDWHQHFIGGCQGLLCPVAGRGHFRPRDGDELKSVPVVNR